MLQVLCNRFNGTYANMFMPAGCIFASSNIIVGNFGMLRFHGELDTAAYMNFPVLALMMMAFVFTFYPNNASVNETSDEEQRRALLAGITFLKFRNMGLRMPKRADVPAAAGPSSENPRNQTISTKDNEKLLVLYFGVTAAI
jgi:hypothetical protein